MLFTCIKSWFFRNHLANFHQISHWSFCWNVIDCLFKWSCSIDCQAHIFFFKTKNCSNDDIFISWDDRIGKMLHNICMSAVAVSLRWANRGPWAFCYFLFFIFINFFLARSLVRTEFNISIPCANSASDQLTIFSYFFFHKKGFCISCKVSHKMTICMKCQSLFFWAKILVKKIKYHLLIFIQHAKCYNKLFLKCSYWSFIADFINKKSTCNYAKLW